MDGDDIAGVHLDFYFPIRFTALSMYVRVNIGIDRDFVVGRLHNLIYKTTAATATATVRSSHDEFFDETWTSL